MSEVCSDFLCVSLGGKSHPSLVFFSVFAVRRARINAGGRERARVTSAGRPYIAAEADDNWLGVGAADGDKGSDLPCKT